MTQSAPISTLLRRYPSVETVLGWHGVETDDLGPGLSLSAVCWLHDLDEAQVMRDLRAAGGWDEDELFVPPDTLDAPDASAAPGC